MRDEKRMQCYAIGVVKYPELPVYDKLIGCKGDVYVGKRGKFCGVGKEQCYQDKAEAELWINKFLSKRIDAELFEFCVVKMDVGQEYFDTQLKPKCFYIKIVKVPSDRFVGRENIKPIYLRGELVLGRGNTLAKQGKQRWFEYKNEAVSHLEKIAKSEAFKGFKFEILPSQ